MGGGIDLVGFEFPPGLLLIRTIRTSADHVCNVVLRAALHTNGAEVHANVKIPGCGKRTGDFLSPGVAVVVDSRLLSRRDRSQQCHRDQHSGKL